MEEGIKHMRRMLLPEKKIKSKIKNDEMSVSFEELEKYVKEDVVVVQVILNKLDILSVNQSGIISISNLLEGLNYTIPNGAILTIQKHNDGIIVATNILGDNDLDERREMILFENLNMSDLSIYGSSLNTLFDVYIFEQD